MAGYLGFWLLLMTNQSYPFTPEIEAEAAIVANSACSAQAPNVTRIIPAKPPPTSIATSGPPLRHVPPAPLEKHPNQPKRYQGPERTKPQ